MKAAELIMDWNLWPRHEANALDSTNLKKLKEAMLAGVKLPPVIVNRKDNRIIDGFHRTKTALNLYGDDANIEVIYKDFKNDAEMFLESARLNNNHGLPLSPRDRTHVILKAKKFNIPAIEVAKALGMKIEETARFLEKRTATNREGELIPLSGGCLSLRGQVLTAKQEDYVRTAPGTNAQLYATLLLKALDAGAINLSENILETLKKLNKKITAILEAQNGSSN